MWCRSPAVFSALAVCGLLIPPVSLAATEDPTGSGQPVGKPASPPAVEADRSVSTAGTETGHDDADRSRVPDGVEPRSATHGEGAEAVAPPRDRHSDEASPPQPGPTTSRAHRTIDPSALAQQTAVDVNMAMVLGVALLAGLLLLLVMWLILRGTGSRMKS